MSFRFEFDPVHRILITRLEGELTDNLLKKIDVEIRRHLTEKLPNVHIVECSAVTKFSMSPESVRYLAKRDPALPGGSCRRIFVTPSTVGFGLARMFQIAGEPHHDSVAIVRSLDEAFTAIGVKTSNPEPLE